MMLRNDHMSSKEPLDRKEMAILKPRVINSVINTLLPADLIISSS